MDEAGTPKDKLWNLYLQPLGPDTPPSKRMARLQERMDDGGSGGSYEPLPKLLLSEIDEVDLSCACIGSLLRLLGRCNAS